MQRYVAFIYFEADVHNTIVEPKQDMAKQVHPVGFMVVDTDVDTIIREWPKEWRGPLVEPMDEGRNQEDLPANQGGNIDVGDDGENGQDNG